MQSFRFLGGVFLQGPSKETHSGSSSAPKSKVRFPVVGKVTSKQIESLPLVPYRAVMESTDQFLGSDYQTEWIYSLVLEERLTEPKYRGWNVFRRVETPNESESDLVLIGKASA